MSLPVAASFLDALDHFATARILVLGDVMLDRYVYGQVERMSPEAPIPVLAYNREQAMPGGAANVARNIAALGGQAVLLGVVGQDAAGRAIESLCANEKRITAHLVIDITRPTTEKTRFIAGRQQLLRLDREKAAPLSDDAVRSLIKAFEEVLPTLDLVILSDYAKGVLTDAVLAHVIERARRLQKPVLADPKSADFNRYRGVSLLTPNRAELARAAGRACEDAASVSDAARALMERHGLPALLVTRSEQGMTLIRTGLAPLNLTAEAREVFDVSGAGDTVMAALALALAVEMPMDDAARFANLAAGIVVGKSGTAAVHPDDLRAALQRSGRLAGAAKILSRAELLGRVESWRAAGQTIGFANGCFDLLHPGHIQLLEAARAACGRLIVGLNSDSSVQRLKGPARPVQPQDARALMLAALGMVDAVALFDEDTPIDLIRAIRPDLLVKGSDYRIDQVVGADFIQSYGGRVLLVDLVAGHSTTALIEKSRAKDAAS